MKPQLKNLLPFFILLFVVIGCTEEARRGNAKVDEREKVVEILNKQFDLPTADVCAIRFSMEKYDGNRGKTLYATACSLLDKETLRSSDILTPENIALIKNAEFETLKIYQHGRIIEVVQIQ
jgi:hypothetical protein